MECSFLIHQSHSNYFLMCAPTTIVRRCFSCYRCPDRTTEHQSCHKSGQYFFELIISSVKKRPTESSIGLCLFDYYKMLILCARQVSIISFGQILAWTSPTCALPNNNIHKRDCPIPPPIVYGNSLFKII